MIQKKKFSDAIAANISVVEELLPVVSPTKNGLATYNSNRVRFTSSLNKAFKIFDGNPLPDNTSYPINLSIIQNGSPYTGTAFFIIGVSTTGSINIHCLKNIGYGTEGILFFVYNKVLYVKITKAGGYVFIDGSPTLSEEINDIPSDATPVSYTI